MQFKIATKDLSKFAAMNIVCDGDAVTLSFDDSSATEHIIETACNAFERFEPSFLGRN